MRLLEIFVQPDTHDEIVAKYFLFYIVRSSFCLVEKIVSAWRLKRTIHQGPV